MLMSIAFSQQCEDCLKVNQNLLSMDDFICNHMYV